jgi:hypothetical protein
MTVVGDADEAAATGFDVDSDARSFGVEGILEEFLDDGGRPFDYLAGGDFVGDHVGEYTDAAQEDIVRVGGRGSAETA